MSSVKTPPGTGCTPAISLQGNSNTGLYSPGHDQLVFSAGGIQTAIMDDKLPLILKRGGKEIDVWDICQRVLILEQLMTPEQREKYVEAVQAMQNLELLAETDL